MKFFEPSGPDDFQGGYWAESQCSDGALVHWHHAGTLSVPMGETIGIYFPTRAEARAGMVPHPAPARGFARTLANIGE